MAHAGTGDVGHLLCLQDDGRVGKVGQVSRVVVVQMGDDDGGDGLRLDAQQPHGFGGPHLEHPSTAGTGRRG